jgi:cell division inhibitor SepF
MGFMDELKKLTQPYDDEEDFFEGADPSFKPQPKAKAEPKIKNPISAAQLAFENSFAESSVGPAEEAAAKKPAAEGGIFGGRGQKKPARQKAPRQRTVNFGGRDTSVLLFSPKSFDEAGELVNYMLQGLTVVMTLEGVPGETARRLLDFLSGIAFALQGKITPVSAKTYFITPQDVDILGTQPEQPESESHYF